MESLYPTSCPSALSPGDTVTKSPSGLRTGDHDDKAILVIYFNLINQ